MTSQHTTCADKSTNTGEQDPSLRDLTTAVMTLERSICELKDNINKVNTREQDEQILSASSPAEIPDQKILNSLKGINDILVNLGTRVSNIEKNFESQAVSLTVIAEQLKIDQEQKASKGLDATEQSHTPQAFASNTTPNKTENGIQTVDSLANNFLQDTEHLHRDRRQKSHIGSEPLKLQDSHETKLLKNNQFHILSSPVKDTPGDNPKRSRESDICNNLLDQLIFYPNSQFVKAPIKLFSNLDGILLDKCTEYTKHFSNREEAYYGSYDYSYSRVVHKARDFKKNSELDKIFTEIQSLFPSIGLNSAMINCYRNNKSYIPFHADDESDLDRRAPIITISLGQSRSMLFRDKRSKETLQTTTVEHGDLLIMSGESQNLYEHSISSRSDNLSVPDEFRISITFRKVKKPNDNIEPDVSDLFLTAPRNKTTLDTNDEFRKSDSQSHIPFPNISRSDIDNTASEAVTKTRRTTKIIPPSNYHVPSRKVNVDNKNGYSARDTLSQRPYFNVLTADINKTANEIGAQTRRSTKIIPPSNYNATKNGHTNLKNNHNRNCLILHDSLLDLYDKDKFYPKARTSLLRTKTLAALNDTDMMRKIRTYECIDTIIIHLGVNDLKHMPPEKLILELKRVLLNLAETSSAKIFFKWVGVSA